jgi:hypothetical protein
MTYRRITAADMIQPEHTPLNRGPKPTFDWIPIANLRVNEAYQRPLGRDSITAIRRIASEFSWLKFGALRVAPIASTDPQQYAVIDGQHRATALALLDITAAPCLISDASEAEQAAAFAAINGNVVRVLALTTFRAAVVSGDPSALALVNICREAGVSIAPYPIQNSSLKPGETSAIGTLKNCIKRYSADTLKLALRCITETSNNVPGAVHANAIQSLCEIIAEYPKLPLAKPFIAQFEAIELDQLDSDARGEKPRHQGDTARARLRDKIKGALAAQQASAA